MNQMPSLEHHFLIAMPTLNDSWFEKAVIYILEDNEQGTTGLVVNLEHNFNIQELLAHFNLSASPENPHLEQKVLRGGPVDMERGFILHEAIGEWKNTISLQDNLAMTVSEDFIEAISENQIPSHFLVCLGFSGWKPGQLAQELQSNSWLTIPYNQALLFDVPMERKWQVSLETLGISPEFLTLEAGHA